MRWKVLLGLGVVATVLVGACDGSSDDKSGYGLAGPFEVGVTFLELAGGRAVDVWYPAGDGDQVGEQFSYNLNDAWPESMRAAAPEAPDIVVDARVDAVASDEGPFPVILESHGLGSSRRDGALNHRHLASWGFVVVAPELVEHNRVTLVGEPPAVEEMESDDVLLASLDAVRRESERAGSPLEQAVDTERLAADGVSLGGRAALGFAGLTEVDAVIGRAPASEDAPEQNAPLLLIASDRDVAVPIEGVRALYGEATPPKGLAVILDGGHNTFTDSCAQIRAAGGIDVEALSEATGFPAEVMEFGNNGCTGEYVDPVAVWPLINHLQVAHFRWALGIDESDELLRPSYINDMYGEFLAEYVWEVEE